MDSEEPELHLLQVGGLPGAAEHRARVQRLRREARRRHSEHLGSVLDANGVTAPVEPVVSVVLDALFDWRDVERGERCACSCHPRLPDDDLHDFGFACPCSKTAADRDADHQRRMAELDAFWASPRGEELTRRQQAEEEQLAAWLDRDPGVTVHSHGGMAPEQWTGEVDGHSFYFRERSDLWRLELDLRPSGRYVKTWTGGDLDDPASFQPREIERGDVIAEGTTTERGYGTTAVERARFIVDTIRTHLRRRDCQVHTVQLKELTTLLGDQLEWCPACGERLSPRP